jgi:hypothetical protein
MKKSVLALVLVFFTVVCLGNLIAKERRGADLVITKTDGQQVKGELIAVKPSSLLLLDSQTGADVSIEIEHIKHVTLEKKSKSIQGTGLGLAIGGGAGAVFGVLMYDVIYIDLDKAGYAALFGAAGAVLGGVIGGIIGANKGKDETIQVEGKSDTEIKEILEKLRRQARILDAQ